jgi:P-type Ca2+ transporter type 2C
VWVGVSVAMGHPSYEGLAVMLAVFLATGVAFLSEYRSDKEFEKLNSQKDSVRVKVQRDAAVHTVPLEEVVVGDLVLLEMGDEIPADGRIAKANELFIDQSLMTGESEPVKKSAAGPDDTADGPEVPGSVFRGTQVVDGVGQMLVTNVGDDTMIGQIARRLSGDPEEDEAPAGETPESREKRVQHKLTISKKATPLQEKLAVLAGLISKIGYIAAVAIFVALLVRGLWVGEVRWPAEGEDSGKVLLASVRALLSYFVYMVIIVVVAVPEGLPMSVTVSLAIAWQKMSKANSLVRQLVACETIGSATVICSDKTGTLTQNKMAVSRLGLGQAVFEKGGSLPHSEVFKGAEPSRSSPLWWVIVNSAANSTASLEEKNGKTLTVGNSTEGALLHWMAAGAWFSPKPLSYLELRTEYPVLYQIHFSSDRKRMTSVVKYDGRPVTLVKGAPEAVLADCTRYLGSDGVVRDLTPEVRAEIQGRIFAAAGDAMRTLTRTRSTTAGPRSRRGSSSTAGWGSATRCART